MLLLISANLIGLMNRFYLLFLFTSFIISQNDIITKEFKFYKSNEVEEIDFSSVLDFINGNYTIKIVDINNIKFKKIKRTLIENCDLNFLLSHKSNDIKISRCKDHLSYDGDIIINDNDYIVSIDNDKYEFLNCEFTFWVSGNFTNISNSNDKIKDDGILREYYDNGLLHIEYNFSNGKKNGMQKRWYENNQLEMIYYYKMGKLDGLQKKWHPNGQLRGEWNYSNDKLNGITKEWYPNKQLKFIKVYNMGTLVEIIEHYNPDGSVVQ